MEGTGKRTQAFRIGRILRGPLDFNGKKVSMEDPVSKFFDILLYDTKPHLRYGILYSPTAKEDKVHEHEVIGVPFTREVQDMLDPERTGPPLYTIKWINSKALADVPKV
jgi:hypothetical protein